MSENQAALDKERVRQRERWAKDPSYRARHIQQSKDYAKRHKKDPEFRKRKARNRRKCLYGLTDKEFLSAISSQRNLCALCRRPLRPPFIDHDHKTGRVRGLLCGKCNLGLGMFQDSPELLRLAATYLEAWSV